MANVNKLFKCLGYIVHTKADLTKKEIKNVINEFMSICHCCFYHVSYCNWKIFN
ncbi:unnamed protein product [Macrosiphum euphorbiae]|uniref:Caspase family p20 domain-containing protein n=1 Tax=Macrosiphum euphorbiae TaxID=13131 RepID=A0AAV0WDE7_9HEMI|nr:unnamed protein product [Macrosiphum euphorbiae]